MCASITFDEPGCDETTKNRSADDLVFTTGHGAPLRSTNWRTQVWLPAFASLRVVAHPGEFECAGNDQSSRTELSKHVRIDLGGGRSFT